MFGMSEAYERDSFLTTYAKWHYGQGLRELFGVVGNFLWFIKHFFSFKLLLNTLFAPWKGLRALGFLSKVLVLAVGSVAYAVVLTLSFFVLLIWILAPVVLIGSAVLSATFFAI